MRTKKNVCGSHQQAVLIFLEHSNSSVSQPQIFKHLTKTTIWKQATSIDSKEASFKKALSSLEEKGFIQKSSSNSKTGAKIVSITDDGRKFLNKDPSVSHLSINSNNSNSKEKTEISPLELVSLESSFNRTDLLLDFQNLATTINRKSIQVLDKLGNKCGAKAIVASSFYYFSEMTIEEIPSFVGITKSEFNILKKETEEIFFSGCLGKEIQKIFNSSSKKELAKVILPINSYFPEDFIRYCSSPDSFYGAILGYELFVEELLHKGFLQTTTELIDYFESLIKKFESHEKLKQDPNKKKILIDVLKGIVKTFSEGKIMPCSPFSSY